MLSAFYTTPLVVVFVSLPRQFIQLLYFIGTVYNSYEPIFFQSLANPFIFRCIDGVLIDGKDTGLSRMIYR